MSAANALTSNPNSKFLEALQALGCAVKQEASGDRLEFRYQGGNYLASPSKAGDALCVIYPSFLDVANFANASDANAAVHELNAKVAIARVFIVDGELCASAETYVSGDMDIERLIVKMIDLIHSMCIQMRVKRELSICTVATAAVSARGIACIDSGMAVH